MVSDVQRPHARRSMNVMNVGFLFNAGGHLLKRLRDHLGKKELPTHHHCRKLHRENDDENASS